MNKFIKMLARPITDTGDKITDAYGWGALAVWLTNLCFYLFGLTLTDLHSKWWLVIVVYFYLATPALADLLVKTRNLITNRIVDGIFRTEKEKEKPEMIDYTMALWAYAPKTGSLEHYEPLFSSGTNPPKTDYVDLHKSFAAVNVIYYICLFGAVFGFIYGILVAPFLLVLIGLPLILAFWGWVYVSALQVLAPRKKNEWNTN